LEPHWSILLEVTKASPIDTDMNNWGQTPFPVQKRPKRTPVIVKHAGVTPLLTGTESTSKKVVEQSTRAFKKMATFDEAIVGK
jgi:hypothetical protein